MPTFKRSSDKDDYSQSIHSDESQGKGTHQYHEIEQQDPSETIKEVIPRLTEEEQEVINKRRNSRQFQQELLAMLPSDSSATEISVEMEAILKEWAKEIEPVLKKSSTGLPLKLKAGIEERTGIDMSDVIVHYNSSLPTNMGLLAYTEGNNIYLAAGQEKHLPHEAWHVVQQKQGRVNPTMLVQNKNFNASDDLEDEADTMAPKIDKESTAPTQNLKKVSPPQEETIQPKLKKEALNVVGEKHDFSGARRKEEAKFISKYLGFKNKNLWLENEFRVGLPPKKKKDDQRPFADPFELRFLQRLWLGRQLVDGIAIHRDFPNVVERMKEQIQSAQAGKDGFELDENRKNYYVGLLASIEAWPTMFIRDVRQEIDELHNRIKTHIADERGIEPEALDGMLEIGKERSVAMHNAANQGVQNGLVGVWKIGEQHISDIKEMDAAGVEYELTDVVEFTAAFDNKTIDPTPEQIEEARKKKKM